MALYGAVSAFGRQLSKVPSPNINKSWGCSSGACLTYVRLSFQFLVPQNGILVSSWKLPLKKTYSCKTKSQTLLQFISLANKIISVETKRAQVVGLQQESLPHCKRGTKTVTWPALLRMGDSVLMWKPQSSQAWWLTPDPTLGTGWLLWLLGQPELEGILGQPGVEMLSQNQPTKHTHKQN